MKHHSSRHLLQVFIFKKPQTIVSMPAARDVILTMRRRHPIAAWILAAGLALSGVVEGLASLELRRASERVEVLRLGCEGGPVDWTIPDRPRPFGKPIPIPEGFVEEPGPPAPLPARPGSDVPENQDQDFVPLIRARPRSDVPEDQDFIPEDQDFIPIIRDEVVPGVRGRPGKDYVSVGNDVLPITNNGIVYYDRREPQNAALITAACNPTSWLFDSTAEPMQSISDAYERQQAWKLRSRFVLLLIVVFSIPWLWYFLLARVRELSDSIRGRT